MALLLAAAPAALAQNDGRSDRGFDEDDTSQTNTMLENILDRFPDSDTNRDGILDAEEGKAFLAKLRERAENARDRRRNWRDRPEPTHRDLAYGPDDKHRLDLYLAEVEDKDTLTPLVVFFHGGQFITGSKSDTGTLNVDALLRAGISVASVEYRHTREAPFPAPFNDAARAVQFLRLTAATYNLDPDRFAGHGEEAGGNLALYLALHDDLATANPTDEQIEDAQLNPDPQAALPPRPNDEADEAGEDALPETPAWQTPELLKQSTRLSAAVARHPIASFDPRSWAEHKVPMNGHERLINKYLDVRYLEPLEDPDVIALVEDVSPLALISPGDPELLLMSQYPDLELQDDSTWTIVAHHPIQSQLIAKAMRAKGNRATVRYRGMKNDPGTSSVDFFIEKLK
ncbi:MAG: alpha/beta hydrolase fold domain-containing protein [Phycisphaeraceae bacterium]